jgi:hypothetical protein
MEILHRLTRLENMRGILQRATYLAKLDGYGPFANQLRPLAKGYQSKAILHLVEQYLETRTSVTERGTINRMEAILKVFSLSLGRKSAHRCYSTLLRR